MEHPAHGYECVGALAAVPMLSGLDRKTEKLSKEFSERTFPAGAVVVRQGDDRGIGFFVIADGTATVSVGRRGRRQARARRSLRGGRADRGRVRTATVTAESDLHTYVMTMWDFRAFVQGDAEVAWNLLVQLAQMVQRQSGHHS